MDSPGRHAGILDRLRRDGRVDVGDLAEAFTTSEVTVRRDLDALADAGVLRRVHGGAVSLLLRGEELPFAMREMDSAATKDRMGAAVASLVQEGEAVVVDSGTTGLAVARALVGRRLTVMPLSLHAAAALSATSSVHLLLPGGTVRHGEGSLVGPIAEANLRSRRRGHPHRPGGRGRQVRPHRPGRGVRRQRRRRPRHRPRRTTGGAGPSA